MTKDQHDQPAYLLIREIRSAFNDLKALSDVMNQDLGVTAAMRAVLEQLQINGPQTVPQIAGARNVSRQHIQLLTDALAQRGLIAYGNNPQHKRSKLVTLTGDGANLFGRIAARETDALKTVAAILNDDDMLQAQQAVNELRRALAGLISRPHDPDPDRPARPRETRT